MLSVAGVVVSPRSLEHIPGLFHRSRTERSANIEHARADPRQIVGVFRARAADAGRRAGRAARGRTRPIAIDETGGILPHADSARASRSPIRGPSPGCPGVRRPPDAPSSSACSRAAPFRESSSRLRRARPWLDSVTIDELEHIGACACTRHRPRRGAGCRRRGVQAGIARRHVQPSESGMRSSSSVSAALTATFPNPPSPSEAVARHRRTPRK
jgi:hypothetical protein